jgi:hypothetical protein
VSCVLRKVLRQEACTNHYYAFDGTIRRSYASAMLNLVTVHGLLIEMVGSGSICLVS